MMNAESLKYKIKIKSKETSVSPQELMQMYFFERLLYRISISKYKDNFILKGGLLLAAIIGDDRRTTQDMDTMLKGIQLTKEELLNIISNIINIDSDDGIIFKISKIEDIRLQDIYGGLKVYLEGKKDGLKVNLTIDVTVGDPITPKEITFKYKSMFDEGYIKIMAFTKETIIAEKFETLLANTVGNTRAKDFYDLYMLLNEYYEELNKPNLVTAIKRTLKRRDTFHLLSEVSNLFEIVKSSEKLKDNWLKYQKRYPFAKNISYDKVMNSINLVVELLEKESVVI